MGYFDRTRETRAEASALGGDAKIRTDGFVLNVLVQREDGMGVAAGELPGYGFPVGLGFAAGKDPAAARAFAESLIRTLRQRWRVEIASGEEGLRASDTCKPSRTPRLSE